MTGRFSLLEWLSPPPYLSVVAAVRNDDHGGNFLSRLTAFLNHLLGQCRIHRLSAEVVLVEWNPPPDRPPLDQVLRWPPVPAGCSVRLVRVPPEIHRRYKHAEALPLYQMIAKNAGIRRARGEFILATNADILLTDELVGFLAQRRLEKGKMYRIDRHDVMAGVPVQASVGERLDYCRRHLIRVNRREGTFRLDADGTLAMARIDIADPGSGIRLGGGWYAAETSPTGEPIRWVNNNAEILLRRTARELPAVLVLELETGPGVDYRPLQVQLLDAQATLIEQVRVEGRRAHHFRLPPPQALHEQFRLLVSEEGHSIPTDPRVLNLCVYGCRWEEPVPGSSAVKQDQRPLPVQPGATGGQQPSPPPLAPVWLHINGCGDFTLLHRDHWFDLRGYPEFDSFSMHIDSLFCWTAHQSGAAEVVLEDPMRIYHIEHDSGSGWTPEGERLLVSRTTGQGIPWVEFPNVIRMALEMRRHQAPMIFNLSGWGLGFDKLHQRVIR